jgi:hypothetical protein
MTITPESSALGGLFIRTNPEGASVSLWVGNDEINIDLNKCQRVKIAEILFSPVSDVHQIAGTAVRKFTVQNL